MPDKTLRTVGVIYQISLSELHPHPQNPFANPNVRLSFIWASENIATNTPTVYEKYLPIFAELLSDENERIRIEAPEIFRILGKRKPEFALPYLERLDYIATHDKVSFVRIHAKGAIKATLSKVTIEPDAQTQSR